VKELCAALAEAERGGHRFYRSQVVPRLLSAGVNPFRWNQHPESRQAVLAEAIQRGVGAHQQNRQPQDSGLSHYQPIRLNRAEAGIPDEAQRFHPIAVHGDSIAEAIEEERATCELLLS